MSKSRNGRPANKGITRNYKPLSEEFCKSIINNNKNKGKGNTAKITDNLVDNPNNKYITLFNSDNSAHITREYDEENSDKVIGFRVTTKANSYLIESSKNTFDIVVEMSHFGFAYNQIKSLLDITHKQYETYKPKDFETMRDFLFILSLVPQSLYRCNDILHYIKQFPYMIVENPTVTGLSLKAGITKNQAKKCFDIYNGKRYSHLVSAARKKLAEQKKNEEDAVNTENTENSVITPVQESPAEPELVVTETSVVEKTEDVAVTMEIEYSNIESTVEVEDEPFVGVEPHIEISSNDSEEIEMEGNLEDTSDNNSEDDVETDDSMEVEEDSIPHTRKGRKSEPITIEDYQVQLGFMGIPFDFKGISVDIKNGMTNSTFKQYIHESNKEGISNLLYPMVYLDHCYSYSSPFYPAEDKILELYYKDIGSKVVDVISKVIPDYVKRPDYEYLFRVREKGYKTPHPDVGFDMFNEDISLIQALYPKVKKSPTKYFFWLETYDLLCIVEKLGLGENTSKKVKNIIDVSSVDIKPYIESALKLKEVVYHNSFWTSDIHDIFKEEFKNNGLSVLFLIEGLTEDECLEHARLYKINQNYTTKEVADMREVYMKGGFEALVKEFYYRTESALKFKVEEQNWEEERNAILLEQEIEKRVSERIALEKELLKEELRKEVLGEELEKYKDSLVIEITPKVRAEVVESVSTKIKGPVMQGIKFEMPDMVRKSALKDLPNVLPQKIVNKIDSLMREEMAKLS